jgi:hypothetical protein
MPEQRAYVDIMGSFRRGAGRQRAGAGDYEGAMRADPDNAETYAGLADRQRRNQDRDMMQGAQRTYAQALAGGNYEDAATVAGKMGDAEGVTGARAAQQEVTEQQRLELWRGANQGLSELEQIAAANGEGYDAFIARGRQALQRNPDMDPELRRLIESAPPAFNPSYVNGFRTYARTLRDQLLTPQQQAEMDLRRENQQNEGWDLDAYGRPYQMRGGIVRRRDEQGNVVVDTTPVPVPRDRVPGPRTYGTAGLTDEQIGNEQAFADDWRSVYNNWAEISTEAGRLEAAYNQNTSAGDLALVVGFTKMLDPGSVAREGEVALTQSAASVLDQVRNLPTQWQQGRTRLPPAVRENLIAAARAMMPVYRDAYERIASDYRYTAEQYGYDPARVMMGYRPQGGGGGGGGGAGGGLPPAAERVDGESYQWTDSRGQQRSGVWDEQTQTFESDNP